MIVKPAYQKVNSSDIQEPRKLSDKLYNFRKDMWWHFPLFLWRRWTVWTMQRQFSKGSNHWMYWESSSRNYWCYHHGNPLRWYCWMPGWPRWKLWRWQDDIIHFYYCASPDNNLYLPLLGLCKVTILEKFCLSGLQQWEYWLRVYAI